MSNNAETLRARIVKAVGALTRDKDVRKALMLDIRDLCAELLRADKTPNNAPPPPRRPLDRVSQQSSYMGGGPTPYQQQMKWKKRV